MAISQVVRSQVEGAIGIAELIAEDRLDSRDPVVVSQIATALLIESMRDDLEIALSSLSIDIHSIEQAMEKGSV